MKVPGVQVDAVNRLYQAYLSALEKEPKIVKPGDCTIEMEQEKGDKGVHA